jgi:hypothetical protein
MLKFVSDIDNIDMERPIRFTGETFYQYPNKVGKR